MTRSFPWATVHGSASVVGEGCVCQHFERTLLGCKPPTFSGMDPLRQARRSNLKPFIDEGPNDRADALEQRGVNALMDVVLPRFLKTEQRCNLVCRQRRFEDVEGGEAYLVPWPLACLLYTSPSPRDVP